MQCVWNGVFVRTEVEVPDYSQLGDDGLPLYMTVELNPKKDFKDNAKLCFKQAHLLPAVTGAPSSPIETSVWPWLGGIRGKKTGSCFSMISSC